MIIFPDVITFLVCTTCLSTPMTLVCLCSYFSPRDITTAEYGFLSAFILFLVVYERIIYKKAKKKYYSKQ